MKKQKLFLTLLLLFLTAKIGISQTPAFEWAISSGSSAHDWNRSIVTDPQGNVYSTGWFQGTVDFNTGVGDSILNSAGSTDLFLSKYDANGNFVWVKHFPGSGDDEGIDVILDDDKNIFLTGRFENTVDFDPGPGVFNLSSAGLRDAFLVKLDSSANFVWAKRFGGGGDVRSHSVSLDSTSGNLCMTGIFKGVADFDPGPPVYNLTSAGNFDAFIVKLDENGNFIWSNRIGSSQWDQGSDLKFNSAGDVLITGIYSGTVDFDPGIGVLNMSSNGGYDNYVLKLNSLGGFVWVKTFGGSGLDISSAIELDEEEKIILTGRYSNTVDFDPGIGIYNMTSSGGYDAFVTKLDDNGDFLWTKGFGSAGDDTGNCIAIDQYSNIYCGGQYQYTVDFDPGIATENHTTSGSTDAYILKLDAGGNFQWTKSIGGTSETLAWAIALLDGDITSIYTTGYFSATTDFEPDLGVFNLSSQGNVDMFIQKMDQCGNSSFFAANACADYSSPSGNYTWTTPGIHLDTVLNGIGCDLVYIIDLIIDSNTGTDVQTACDAYLWIDGNTYTSTTNVPTWTLTNAAGCDSIVTLDLTVNYSNAGTDVQTACNSFTWMDGNTYTSTTNTPTWTLTNADGCDSIVTLDLMVNYSNAGTDVQTACNSFTWMDGNTYTASNNTATWLETNADGCDSLVTLDLTINYSNTGTDVQTACDSYTWVDGNTYTSSNNTATWLETNAAGCDSLVTLDLTVNYSNAGTDIQTACDSYTWIDGNTYTASNNTATWIETNVAGCDSIVTLDLTINPLPDNNVTQSGSLLTADQVGATYQWLDCNDNNAVINGETNQSYTPTSITGDYAVEVTLNGCVDTSACFVVDYTGISEIYAEVISVHPNPTSDVLTISGLNQVKGLKEMEITSSTGEIVMKSNDLENELNVSDLPTGVYFLNIIHEAGIETIRFMKL